MARPRVKCKYGCGYRSETPATLSRHERDRCPDRPDVTADAPTPVEADATHSNGAPTATQVRQEVELELATVTVLNAKFPKGIKPAEYARAVACMKAVDSA